MASGTIAIAGLQLGDLKRSFRVKANRKTAKAGDVITFTITATGVADRTVRSYYITGVEPIDLTGGKTNGLFYLRQGKAEVFVQIAEDYDRDKDQELVFNVIDSKSALFKIKRPPQAKVTIKGDGESTGEEQRKRLRESRENKQLRGRNSKSLPPSKGGLARQDPIYPVNVREVAPKALKSGTKALPGMRQRALPPGAPRGLPAASSAPRALPPAGMKALPASRQIVDITPVSKSVTPMGGALAKGGTAAGGGALAKGGAGALKGVKAGGAASLLTAGLEFGSRMDSGQNVVQAGVGTAASTAGGLVGASKGAAVGAALGSVVPGLGTAIGGLLGAVIGGVGGSMLAGGAADAVTGANRQQFNEGAHILPKMTDMPFNMPGLSGSFNEPGNPEVMSITPLDDPLKALQSISGIASMVPGLGGIGAMGSMLGGMGSLFGGKPKEYSGIATAIADEMDDRGFGDPLGIQGKGKNKSFGNMTRDMLGSAMGDMLKEIFGGLFGGNNAGTNTGSNTSSSSSSTMGDDVFSVISGGEGDVNSVNRGTAGDTPGGARALVGKNLTDMTVDEVHANQYPNGAGLFAVGKYQIIPDTMKGFIQYLQGQGINTSTTKFDEATQDKFKTYVMDVKRPAVGKYIRGEAGSSRDEAAQELAREFASVGITYDEAGRRRGQSRYAGIGGNAASITPEQIAAGLDSSRNAYANGGLNSPTLTPMPGGGGGQTVVLAGGTNTYGDPLGAARDMTAAIRNLKNKGYNVVVVPPNGNDRRFKAVHDSVKNSARQEGVEVIEAVYGGADGNDPLHLTPQAVTSIQSKYPNAIYMGDSNAVRLNGYVTQTGVNRVGAQTSEIKQQAQNFQRAAQPAVAVRPQTNAGIQQTSYQPNAGIQQTSYNPTVVPMTSPNGGAAGGSIIEYLTGDPNHMGYRADHAGNNYHEHLAFRTVEEKERAKAALIANGIRIGSELRPGDTGSYHSVGLALDVPASQVPVGQEPELSRRVREILAANGFSGKGIGSSTGMQRPAGSPMQMNPGFQQMSNQQPQGNPEDFFAFAMGAQGMQYSPPPGASTTPDNLLATSASTSVNSASRPVTVVNSPVSTTNSVSGDSGGGGYASVAGGAMSDAGLLAYLAKQRLLTLGA